MYATVITPELSPYRITAEDKLWAARASQFEGHDPADTLWTWTQRYALPAYRRRYASLADLIRAHSQPVNPIWQRTGSKCRPGGQYASTDRCSEARLQRRDAAAAIRFSQLRPEVQRTVEAWAQGILPNPVPTSVDFADPSVSRAFVSRNPGSQIIKEAGNFFISTPESQRWGPGHVRMVPASGVARLMPSVGGKTTTTIVSALVLASAVALTGSLVYVAWTRRVA